MLRRKNKYHKKNKKPEIRRPSNFKKEVFDIGIDMKAAHIEVLNAQECIARAKRDNNIALAEELGLELVKSVEARAIAVQTVVSNKGIRSPGLSKESLCTKDDYLEMLQKLETIILNPKGYSATPLDRIYIPKPDGSKRPLSIPSYTDRCLQALFKLAVEPISEEMADMSSYGFRPIRNVSWAVARTLNLIQNPLAKYNYVVEVDIKGCFDNIDQTFLSNLVPVIPKTILWQWLSCGYFERGNEELYPTYLGVPQGGIISPLFCNLTLDGLETHLIQSIKLAKTGSQGAALCRYADDMVCTTTTEQNAQIALKAIKEFLQMRGLEIKEAKTRIVAINEPNNSFDFLGYNFRKIYRKNRKRLVARIGIPLKAVRNLKKKIKTLTTNPMALHNYIDKVNDVLRGWAQAYRYAHNSMYIYRTLRYWSWKQYYKKTYKMVKNKYDKANHTEIHERVMNQYFSEYQSYKTWPTIYDSKGKAHVLFDIASTSYVNPVYTNRAANPYILEDRELIDSVNLKLKRTWREAVLERSMACCGLCSRRLDLNYVPYELHHILPRRFGGKDNIKNMIPLCKVPCHQSVSNAILKKDVKEIFKFIEIGVLDVPTDYLTNLLDDHN